ncbi:hypothetical protein V1389_14610 [Flavobacterium rakeshii]|uniref:hypothetical protein n=1 Tax=Flavobacterium rakeshii TaxID=1038845 RepID=UPI002E7C08A1|nr:hypothetical protein [Flavobacterium rakeshii]MEE1899578.1 hypothetical protein [Flavobacterium rakeshii]
MKKTCFFSLAMLSAIMFTSCEQEYSTQEETTVNLKTTTGDFDRLFVTPKEVGMRLFSEALVTSMNQSVQLRQIIKQKALEEFNNDNDVLFVMIKDLPTEYGKVQNLIASNLPGGMSKLNEIISGNPTLTILVPTLPEKSFSPSTWDVNGEVPSVGIRLTRTNNIPFIWNSGDEQVIPGNYTPDFPALVVKENERLITDNDPLYQKLSTRVVYSDGLVGIKFLDDLFDAQRSPQSYLYMRTRHVDEKISDAYSLYQEIDGWHRDYLYYNITSGTPNGPMSNDFKEFLGKFKMVGDGYAAYDLIADQTDDPSVNPKPEGGNWAHWTEGQFEFQVSFLINSTGGSGEETNRYFPVRPDDLFQLTYSKHEKGKWFWKKTWYTLDDIDNKTLLLNIPVVVWDLEDKSIEVEVTFYEVDIPSTTTYTTSHVSEFATNFELNTSLGETQKVGMKFGASAKETNTRTISRVMTQGNDPLGSDIVEFGDDVIVGRRNAPFFGSYWKIRSYSTGSVEFTFEPKRVQ